MSQIKLDDAERLLEKLGLCQHGTTPTKGGIGRIKACQDFQDRTINTVIDLLVKDCGFGESKGCGAIYHLRSLMNAQPEVGPDPDWRELLVEAVRMIDEMRGHLDRDFIGTSSSTGELLSRCDAAFAATESPDRPAK